MSLCPDCLSLSLSLSVREWIREKRHITVSYIPTPLPTPPRNSTRSELSLQHHHYIIIMSSSLHHYYVIIITSLLCHHHYIIITSSEIELCVSCQMVKCLQSRGLVLRPSVHKQILELAADLGDPIKAGQAVSAIRRSGQRLSATAFSRYIIANAKSRVNCLQSTF